MSFDSYSGAFFGSYAKIYNHAKICYIFVFSLGESNPKEKTDLLLWLFVPCVVPSMCPCQSAMTVKNLQPWEKEREKTQGERFLKSFVNMSQPVSPARLSSYECVSLKRGTPRCSCSPVSSSLTLPVAFHTLSLCGVSRGSARPVAEGHCSHLPGNLDLVPLDPSWRILWRPEAQQR